MLSLFLYQVLVLTFPWMIHWNSVASSQKLWKRQAVNLCPNNKWKEFNGMCFLQVKRKTPHWEASRRCRNKFVGSELAKIRSKDDLKFIDSSFGFDNYWIGLKQKSGTRWRGELVWQDGSNGTFVNFAPGEPTSYDGEDCVGMWEGGGYFDHVCKEKYWSICTVPASVDHCKTKNVWCHENAQCYSTFLTFVCLCNDGFVGDGVSSCKTSYGCPNAEWKEHKGHCFIANPKKLTYLAARRSCKSEYGGSSLAKFRYEGDRIFFQNSFKFSGHRWLGLRRTTSWRDELKWDDKSIVTYKSYAVSQPEDFHNSQYCIITSNEGQWDDSICDIPFGSFCSIDASQSRDDKNTTTLKTTVNLCPNKKWREHNGICYLAVKYELKHWESNNVCKNKFHHCYLAKIRSGDDLRFIVDTFEFKKPYWIGLRQKTGTRWRGELAWQDGSNGTFLNFHNGEPTNYAYEDCIMIAEGGGYFDHRCDEKFWSICSVPASVDHCKTKKIRCHENAQCYNTYSWFVCLCNDGFVGDGKSSCNKSNGCPDDQWKEHKGLCYREDLEKLVFEGARHNCRSKYKGSTLATIRYDGDQNFIVNKYRFHGYRWIGLFYFEKRGLYWDDKSFNTYFSFGRTEPNFFNGQQLCYIMHSKGEWYDDFCNVYHAMFCSVKALDSGIAITTTTVKTTTVKTTTVKTTTVKTTTVKTTTIKTKTVGTTTTAGTTTTDNGSASAVSGETGPILGFVGCVLVVGVFFSYKKYRSQRNNAQKDDMYSKEVEY